MVHPGVPRQNATACVICELEIALGRVNRMFDRHVDEGERYMVDDLVGFWHEREFGKLLDDAARDLIRKWRRFGFTNMLKIETGDFFEEDESDDAVRAMIQKAIKDEDAEPNPILQVNRQNFLGMVEAILQGGVCPITDYPDAETGAPMKVIPADDLPHVMSEIRRRADSPHNKEGVPEDAVEEHKDLLASIWLYVDWKYVTRQLTTEQKELWAAAIEETSEREHPGDGTKADRWWQ